MKDAEGCKSFELGRCHPVEQPNGRRTNERPEGFNPIATLPANLPKWRYRPKQGGKSRRLTIEIQRLDGVALLRDNPSLPAGRDAFRHEAGIGATPQAARDRRRGRRFPMSAPCRVEQRLDDEWLDAAD
jgi:hypothetical protein